MNMPRQRNNRRSLPATQFIGMGIGAFETAQLVKEMGGSIQTDSRLGAGTRIRIILPLHPDQVSDRGAEDRQAA